ncbi:MULTISPECIES: PEP-CTERM sorting domain-containing protein [unclassified Coleofasciculus]|uniref:PEP-CTERM sorting domain-containing protein n=1 Tax=unclassified Coleofasciculus TaxID=2692782 RepID=UPI00188222AA|nr:MULTISPECIES: PEP-CTERM sorting domain-containing protein [unclassified Coleofasciculus]MBE9125546.1 PEP-CTERM sorting domain-containing protein [Coleofasciculus sp. LEGE 07081]MBE9147819.1 PEP-CTERM sorting domain-containing protein [Coleofasciculus sp. LEGE 07092]
MKTLLTKITVATAAGAALSLGVMGANPAQAAIFDLEWSGEFFGNGASATGFIDFDPAQIPNPGNNFNLIVDDFSVTVTGATIGNGTFTLADFGQFIFQTPLNSPLDFTQELVGQPATPPALPFGTAGTFGEAGDFNIFSNLSNPNAPNGTFFFQLTTGGETGQNLTLTSFAPRSTTPPASVPEPASVLGLLAVGALGTACKFKGKKNREQNRTQNSTVPRSLAQQQSH